MGQLVYGVSKMNKINKSMTKYGHLGVSNQSDC